MTNEEFNQLTEEQKIVVMGIVDETIIAKMRYHNMITIRDGDIQLTYTPLPQFNEC